MAYLDDTTARVQRGRLSPGKRGTVETLAIMRKLARDGARDPAVRDAAIRIVSRAAPGHDFAGEAAALFAYVRDQVRFVRDPVGVELLQSPRVTLANSAGDCDDKATLLAGLLLAIGQPADLRFRAIGVTPNQFSHVYVVTRMRGRDVPMDPTWPETPMGWQVPRPALSGDYRV